MLTTITVRPSTFMKPQSTSSPGLSPRNSAIPVGMVVRRLGLDGVLRFTLVFIEAIYQSLAYNLLPPVYKTFGKSVYQQKSIYIGKRIGKYKGE